MGLSRLDNFLKNARGNILYVNPNDLDATDSIENQGNSMAKPFKTIQRALVEASRFSYQKGKDNDRFDKTTILLFPGEHLVDNRPGWIPDGAGNFRLRSGGESSEFSEFSLTSNFDITRPENDLYKLNSVHGGVILPRGTSIVGLDLRKTKIRPTYVPNPENSNIEHSAVFRVTGACYLWQFSIFDGNPNGRVYKDYTLNQFVPNFSHHKLTCFEYADGVNNVAIDDAFIPASRGTYDRTDLDMYYEKIGIAYGPSSGREIKPDYPDPNVDIAPKVDEFRIVGPTVGSAGITSIRAGDGVLSTTDITVTLDSPIDGLDVDTAITIDGIAADGYNGQYVVEEVLSPTEFTYNVSGAPTDPLPPTANTISGTVNLEINTVNSSSPYIFNVSMRSVWGMCGMLADGDKATGFRSMVVAQFTGISLQKDDNAFLIYDENTGTYQTNDASGKGPLSSNSAAVFRPAYRNYHIKTINDAYIQCVSIFAIGYFAHFDAETGGDQSINNSNSNFGSKALLASGFKREAFPQDDVGYISHIIPPKQIDRRRQSTVEYSSIDVAKTVSVSDSTRLYLYLETNSLVPPDTVIQGYRIGANYSDELNCIIPESKSSVERSAAIVMNGLSGPTSVTAIKRYKVERTVSASLPNNIVNSTITLESNHDLLEGESIRVVSYDGDIPDGIIYNKVYYAITSGLPANQIRLAETYGKALIGNNVPINGRGGILTVESRVSDKSCGDPGHPIQFDQSELNWYLTTESNSGLYSSIVSQGVSELGAATSRTYLKRQIDDRNILDTIYRVRYVIPATAGIATARPPIDGFIVQESSTVIGRTNEEVQKEWSSDAITVLSNEGELRNQHIISGAEWTNGTAYFVSEKPHELSIGSYVKIHNVTSTNNADGSDLVGFNKEMQVVAIPDRKTFVTQLVGDPGTFTNNVSTRNISLPTFKRTEFRETLQVYRAQEVQKYISGTRDGVYHLLVTNNSNKPDSPEFSQFEFSQPITNLYPQFNRDNPVSDPRASASHALDQPIGQVIVNDSQNSITRETLGKALPDFGIGIGLTDVISSVTGTAHTFFTSQDHGFNSASRISVQSSGAGYGFGSGGNETLYNARLIPSGINTTGYYATAKIEVNSSGAIQNAYIMDGGSAYQVGDVLDIVGVTTQAGFIPGTVRVDNVNNAAGDCLTLYGIVPEELESYNQVSYRITGITGGNTRQFTVESSAPVVAAQAGAAIAGLGVTVTQYSNIVPAGKSLSVADFAYNRISGIATITTIEATGFNVGNNFIVSGVDSDFYNGEHDISKINSLTQFEYYAGIRTDTPATTGTKTIFIRAFTAQGGDVTLGNENISGRLVTEYAGITTALSAEVSTSTANTLSITNAANLGLQIGDYLRVGDELLRVSRAVSSNTVSVLRGILGSDATTHINGTVVKRIDIQPIELRRNSVIRASGHTFEYLGYGPGNYSTAFPSKQDRALTDQELLLSNATKSNGGIAVFTGMDDKGSFYVGNKKVNSSTGQEQVYDTPVPTVTGEDILTGISIGFDALSPIEVSVSRSLRVEGGTDRNLISQFDGPVVFNNKVTTNDDIEANNLLVQGTENVSRKISISANKPSLSGNPGDIIFNSNPARGTTLGWIYTTENEWYEAGNVGVSTENNSIIIDSIGIGTIFPEEPLHVVGDSLFQGDIEVEGSVSVANSMTAAFLYGDASNLTNIPSDSLWRLSPTGLGAAQGIYPEQNYVVGIGTFKSDATLELDGGYGTGNVDLIVNNNAVFRGNNTFDGNVTVSGSFISTSFDFSSTTSNITVGVLTATTIESDYLRVGVNTGEAIYTDANDNVGIGSLAPRAKLDVEGSSRFKSYFEDTVTATITSGILDLDLSAGQSFEIVATENITSINLVNRPAGATAFTLKISQDGTGGRTVAFNSVTSGSNPTTIKWSSGGIVPQLTATASATDIYSFVTFAGATSDVYGVVGGQNFS